MLLILSLKARAPNTFVNGMRLRFSTVLYFTPNINLWILTIYFIVSKNASLSQFGGVHGSKPAVAQMQWRNKPLFRRNGDVKFKTGSEAVDLLNEEVRQNLFY